MKISVSKFGRSFFLPIFLLLAGMAAHAKAPNIIFILTDDLDQEVFSHEAKIKALITDQGTKFNNHFVTLSLCCPSRTATLRGQYAHNSGVFTNNLPDGGFAKVYSDGLESSTVATWLQAAGYRTALFGKYLNGYPNAASGKTYIPPGWTRWVSPNGGSPYSEYNYSLNQNGTTVSYGSAPSDYLVDVLSNKAATFINNTLTNYPNKPFFLYVAPYVPHGPATPPPRYANDFPGIKAPRTASFNEVDVSDKPTWIRNKSLLTATQIGNIDDLYRKRRQTIKAVGDLVENLVNTLQANGELNNTYIFFTSDNGFHQGQHRLNSGKNTAYEEDLNVPLVVRGPSIPVGATVDHITANVDFAPTWAEIAGVTPPSFVDGRSLLPLLNGTTPPVWRQALLLEHGGPSITPATTDGLLEPQDPFDVQAASTGGAPIFAGLRIKNQAIGANGPLTYVEYDTGEGELYDLSSDPDQLTNTYSTADPALRATLNSWLTSLRHASGQALRNAEQSTP
jgi:N-acetylglucosamine-6-sulfatase